MSATPLNDNDDTRDPAQTIAALRARIAELEESATQHRLLAVEMRKQKYLVEKILDSLPLNIFVKDHENRFIIMNDHACKVIQRDRSEVIGGTDFDIFPETVARKLRQDDEQVRTQRAPVTREERIVDGNGRERYLLAGKVVARFEETDEALLIGFSIDISDRKRVEMELQDKLELIEQQRATVLKLSTPVLRVWDGVLVLPLIGEITGARAMRVTEQLLQAIAQHRAQEVILDITGVPIVNVETADALIRTVRAARLLGAHCMLVGLSPEVARSLVELQTDLTQIETLATLQEGLRQALRERRVERSHQTPSSLQIQARRQSHQR
jgi:rsbT co-antagonist protein RsbR